MTSPKKGRNFDQKTHSGTSSSGSMGVGGTGSMSRSGVQISQSETRTDDLLSGGLDDDQQRQGFKSGTSPDQLKTGLDKGNKQ